MFSFLNAKRKVGNSNRHLFIRINASQPSSTQAIPVLCIFIKIESDTGRPISIAGCFV